MREKRGSNNRGSCNTQEQTAFRPLFYRRRGIFSRGGQEAIGLEPVGGGGFRINLLDGKNGFLVS